MINIWFLQSGSGDGEDTKVAAVKPQNSDDEDDDFFMEGSGLKEDEPEVPEGQYTLVVIPSRHSGWSSTFCAVCCKRKGRVIVK